MGRLPTVYVKRNDRQPYLPGKLVDSDGVAIALTSAAIVFTMKSAEGVIKVNRQAATITDTPNALFEYRWGATDTTTSGRFYGEFEITPQSGGKFTVPADPSDLLEIIISDDLDAT